MAHLGAAEVATLFTILEPDWCLHLPGAAVSGWHPQATCEPELRGLGSPLRVCASALSSTVMTSNTLLWSFFKINSYSPAHVAQSFENHSHCDSIAVLPSLCPRRD